MPIAEPPDNQPETRSLLRRHGPLLGLGLFVILLSLAAHHWVFPAYSWNRDEPVYLWQVDVLRSGQLTSTDGDAPRFFQPWLTAADDGELFSQYPLGWPLVLLAADVALGSPAPGIALGALLAVFGVYALARELTRDHTVALVAAAAMTASPILVIQGGVYLSYLFSLGLGLLFAATLLSGLRRAIRWRIAAAGALLGWVFMTRPFDAVLWGLPVAGYLLITHRRELWRLMRATAWLAAGLLPVVLATLAYNHRVTGSLTQFPIAAKDPLDTFGFGLRRIMPEVGRVNYGFRRAFFGSARNLINVPLFLVGGPLGVAVASLGLWLNRRKPWVLVLLAIAAAFPLGYVFFWGTYVSSRLARYSGPFYLLPLYAPLCVLMAAGIVAAWRRRPRVGIAVVATLAVATVPLAADRISLNHRLSEVQVPWRDAAGSIKGPALVFVSRSGPYLMFVNPYSANDPGLEGPVLYATDHGGANLDLIGAMPGRTPYVQRLSVPPDALLPRQNPPTPEVTMTRLEVLRGGSISLRLRVSNPEGERAVVASIEVGDLVVWRTLDTRSAEGDVYETEWTIGAALADGRLPLRDRTGRVILGAGYGDTPEDARDALDVRRGFVYRAEGTSVELLLPADTTRAVMLDGKRRWVPVLDATELVVEATPVR